MIVWYNCKVTDIRRSPINRFGLPTPNRFDVLKYCLASWEPLSPLVSEFIFNFELADDHVGREVELEEWIRSIFSQEKIGEISWFRVNNRHQHLEITEHFKTINDDIFYWASNEDFLFLDKNIELFSLGLDYIKNDPDPYAAFMFVHWTEAIGLAMDRPIGITNDGKFYIFQFPFNCGTQLWKTKYYYEMTENLNPDALAYCSDGCVTNKVHKVYVPSKEIVRNYDGYTHVISNPSISPPLTIPPGFFEKSIVIKYGFDERDPNCVNINPLKQLVTADPTGTDYNHWILDDLPLFWKPYIKDIIINPLADHGALKQARDHNYLMMAKHFIHHIPDNSFDNIRKEIG